MIWHGSLSLDKVPKECKAAKMIWTSHDFELEEAPYSSDYLQLTIGIAFIHNKLLKVNSQDISRSLILLSSRSEHQAVAR